MHMLESEKELLCEWLDFNMCALIICRFRAMQIDIFF